MVAEQSYRSTHSDVASAVTADLDMYADLAVENLPRRLDQLARSGNDRGNRGSLAIDLFRSASDSTSWRR